MSVCECVYVCVVYACVFVFMRRVYKKTICIYNFKLDTQNAMRFGRAGEVFIQCIFHRNDHWLFVFNNVLSVQWSSISMPFMVLFQCLASDLILVWIFLLVETRKWIKLIIKIVRHNKISMYNLSHTHIHVHLQIYSLWIVWFDIIIWYKEKLQIHGTYRHSVISMNNNKQFINWPIEFSLVSIFINLFSRLNFQYKIQIYTHFIFNTLVPFITKSWKKANIHLNYN